MNNSVRRTLLESLLGGTPVDDVPNGFEVLGLAVLVVKATTVLDGFNQT